MTEKGLRIDERTGNICAVGTRHHQWASILMATGRYHEADTRFDVALAIARQAEDKELEGLTLQGQGALAANRNQLEHASHLYQQALRLFREAGNQSEIMRTYNLLGVAEHTAGRLGEARAWYEKSHESAMQLKDKVSLACAAQNIALICQDEGETARERGDEPAARRHFEEARCSVEENLRIWQSQQDKPHEAMSLVQLAQIDLRLGNLNSAEQHALRGLAIDEELQIVRELLSDYAILSQIAQARGDLAAAAEWARKRGDLRAELKRRAGGGRGFASQMLKALQALALACAQAGFGDGGLGPAEEEALARLDGLPAPFPDLAPFLRQIAAGQLPPLPAGLTAELRQWLEALVQGIRDASGPTGRQNKAQG